MRQRDIHFELHISVGRACQRRKPTEEGELREEKKNIFLTIIFECLDPAVPEAIFKL